MRREYPTRPWVGVGVVVWQGDRVLLVERGRPPRLGQWGIPGGAQQIGETVFEAAVREVLEETGLRIEPTAIVTVVDAITRDGDGRLQYHYTLVEVAAECAAGEPLAATDVSQAAWFALGEVAQRVEWSETRRVIALAAAQRTTRG